MSPLATTGLVVGVALLVAVPAVRRFTVRVRPVGGRAHDAVTDHPDGSPVLVSPSRPGRQMLRSAVARRSIGLCALVVGTIVLGPLITAAGIAGTWGVARVVPLLEHRRRAREVSAAVPDAIELLVLLVHAGLTPHQAVRAMGEHCPPPISGGFVAVAARLDRGTPLADALAVLPERLGPELAAVSDTLAIAVRHGTPISEALTQLSADARLRRRRLAEAEARRLPVRLSFPLVFCTLPSFLLVAIAPAVLAALSSLGDTSW